MADCRGIFYFLLFCVLNQGTCLSCKEFKESFESEELTGSFGDTFLILLENKVTRIIWDNFCFLDHDVEYNIITSSDAIETSQLLNSITLKKDNQKMGSIILFFSETVALDYMNWERKPMLHIGSTTFVPIDKLGTEYLIVVPKVNATHYSARICSIHNNTQVLTEISDVNRTILEEKEITHLGKHEVLAIDREFDFSGSRILSTCDVAVFCFVYSSFRVDLSNIPMQLLPSKFFGRTFHIPNYYQLFSDGDVEFTIRITSLFENTVVDYTRQNVVLRARGETVDMRGELEVNTKMASTNRFIVTISIHRNAAFRYHVVPDEQYIRHVILMSLSFPTFRLCYNVLENRSIEFSVNVSRFSPWNTSPLEFRNWVTHTNSSFSVGFLEIDFEAEKNVHLYIRSSSPFGGIYRLETFNVFYTYWKLEVLNEECRLIEAESKMCADTCNGTLVDSCEEEGDVESQHTVEGYVYSFTILAALALLFASSVTATKYYNANFKRNRIHSSK